MKKYIFTTVDPADIDTLQTTIVVAEDLRAALIAFREHVLRENKPRTPADDRGDLLNCLDNLRYYRDNTIALTIVAPSDIIVSHEFRGKNAEKSEYVARQLLEIMGDISEGNISEVSPDMFGIQRPFQHITHFELAYLHWAIQLLPDHGTTLNEYTRISEKLLMEQLNRERELRGYETWGDLRRDWGFSLHTMSMGDLPNVTPLPKHTSSN